jgi:hypothetical protein
MLRSQPDRQYGYYLIFEAFVRHEIALRTDPVLVRQRIEVHLDERAVTATTIEPQRQYHLAHVAQNGARPAMHSLDIAASARASVGGVLLSVQVPRSRVIERDGKELTLSQ